MPLFHHKSTSDKSSDGGAEPESKHTSLLRRLSSSSRKSSSQSIEKHGDGESAKPADPPPHSVVASSGKSTSGDAALATKTPTGESTPSSEQQQQRSSRSGERQSDPNKSSSSHSRHQSSSRPPSDNGNLTMSEATARPVDSDALSRDDVQTLFHGAPHFLLEKGRRGRFFPQAFFPYSSPLDITDLQDRRYLKHESFALFTLHSHLPVPHEAAWKPGAPVPTGGLLPSSSTLAAPPSPSPLSATSTPATEAPPSPSPATPTSSLVSSSLPTGAVTRTTSTSSAASTLAGVARLATNRRPMFDLGIYERPNMLSLHGIERGTFGMRAFLERPVADGLVDEKHEHSSSDPEPTNTTCEAGKNSASLTEHLSTSEALKALAHDEGSVHVGKHAPPIDRVALLRDGPKAWKRVGVRDMSLRTVTERLELISKLRDDVVKRGWRYTVLQVWTEEEMGDWLFGELLYPPEKRAGRGGGGGVEAGSKGHELKVQIEALVKVLTTRGAWLDFSLPRERLLFSQNLYAKEAASDGSGVDAMGLRPEIKRRWGLIQLLLSVELVLRLDAALRLGVASHSEKVEVSSVEIHHFNRLRNLKVDWDFVVARRWLDLCYVRKVPKNEVGGAPPAVETPADASPPPKSHHGQKEGGFFGRFKETLHIRDKEKEEDSWPYDCAVLPRQPSVMADGLLRFAEDIGWDADAVEHIRRQLAEKLCDKTLEQREEMLARGTEALDHPHVAQHHKDKSKVELKAAGEHTLGGPLTHTWLGGLIIPGYFACDLLMCALLESDTKQMAVEKLGNMAHPRSGFVLNSRSWWSKLCVVGVVLADADNAVERMGWIGLPTPLSPHDHETGQALGDGWWLIVSKDVPRLRNGERILDGDDMAKESSTLGVGKGHIMASEFGMLTDHAFNGMERMEVTNLRLILKWLPQPQQQQPGDRDQPYEAAVSASVAREGAGEHARKHKLLPLRYSVRFVGGHPCRPPHGHAKQAKQASPQDSGDKLQPLAAPKHLEHLPAHPLHKSYKYSLRSIEEVIDLGPGDELTLPNPTDKEASPVWVIDARGGWQRETLVRAWCASVGRHAIVSRVGVGCIACAVREARALEIGVIIRVEA